MPTLTYNQYLWIIDKLAFILPALVFWLFVYALFYSGILQFRGDVLLTYLALPLNVPLWRFDAYVAIERANHLMDVLTDADFRVYTAVTGFAPGESKRGMNYVYVISDGCMTKVGRTKNVRARLANLATSHSAHLEPVLVMETPDDTNLEAYLHEKLKRRAVRREWFELSKPELRVLEAWAFDQCKRSFPDRDLKVETVTNEAHLVQRFEEVA